MAQSGEQGNNKVAHALRDGAYALNRQLLALETRAQPPHYHRQGKHSMCRHCYTARKVYSVFSTVFLLLLLLVVAVGCPAAGFG